MENLSIKQSLSSSHGQALGQAKGQVKAVPHTPHIQKGKALDGHVGFKPIGNGNDDLSKIGASEDEGGEEQSFSSLLSSDEVINDAMGQAKPDGIGLTSQEPGDRKGNDKGSISKEGKKKFFVDNKMTIVQANQMGEGAGKNGEDGIDGEKNKIVLSIDNIIHQKKDEKKYVINESEKEKEKNKIDLNTVFAFQTTSEKDDIKNVINKNSDEIKEKIEKLIADKKTIVDEQKQKTGSLPSEKNNIMEKTEVKEINKILQSNEVFGKDGIHKNRETSDLPIYFVKTNNQDPGLYGQKNITSSKDLYNISTPQMMKLSSANALFMNDSLPVDTIATSPTMIKSDHSEHLSLADQGLVLMYKNQQAQNDLGPFAQVRNPVFTTVAPMGNSKILIPVTEKDGGPFDEGVGSVSLKQMQMPRSQEAFIPVMQQAENLSSIPKQQLINEIQNYFLTASASKDSKVAVVFDHADLGRVMLQVTKTPDKLIDIRIKTSTDEGRDFFIANKDQLTSLIKVGGPAVGEFIIDRPSHDLMSSLSQTQNALMPKTDSARQDLNRLVDDGPAFSYNPQDQQNDKQQNSQQQDQKFRKDQWNSYLNASAGRENSKSTYNEYMNLS